MKIAYNLVTLIVIIAFPATLFSGLLICPYSPYRQEGAQFVDKLGRPVTAEDYRRFELWQDTMFVTVVPFAGLAIGGVFWRYRRSRSLSTEQVAEPDRLHDK